MKNRLSVFLFICICILVLPCCNKTSFNKTLRINTQFDQHSEFGLDRAIEFAKIRIEDFFPATKASNRFIDEATSMVSGDFFIVNFRNNEGFAVIKVINDVPILIAITDTGHYGENGSGISLLDDLINSGMIFYGPKPPIIDTNILNAGYYTTDTVETTTVIGPLCETGWHQHEPFNMFCPIVSGEHVAAGCVPIAIGQAMSVFSTPTQIQLTYSDNSLVSLSWPQMKTHNFFHSSTCPYCIQNGQLIREIGHRGQINYNTGGMNPNECMSCLQAFNYTYGTYQTYSLSNVTSSLDNDYPTLFFGSTDDDSSHHSWIVDGYRQEIVRYNWTWHYLHIYPSDRDAGYEQYTTWYLHFNYGGYNSTWRAYILAKYSYYGDCETIPVRPISYDIVSSLDTTTNFTHLYDLHILPSVHPQ